MPISRLTLLLLTLTGCASSSSPGGTTAGSPTTAGTSTSSTTAAATTTGAGLAGTTSGEASSTTGGASTTTGGAGTGTFNNCTPTNASTSTSVALQGFAFVPSCISVSAQTTVTFTNQDSASHTVTTDASQPETFDSGTLASNQQYTHQFSTVGTIGVHCNFHPSMHLTVLVK